MSEIKRCPFCGGKAMLQRTTHKRRYYVICKRCGCKTPYFQHQYASNERLQEEAIERWNTRKPTERIVKIVEDNFEEANQFGCGGIITDMVEAIKEEGGIE